MPSPNLKRHLCQADLQKALDECRNGQSPKKVAKRYNVPVKTVFDKLYEKHHPKMEESINLPKHLEDPFCRKLLKIACQGVRLSIGAILEHASNINKLANNLGLEEPCPNAKWWHSFKKRYPEVAAIEEAGYLEDHSSLKKIMDKNDLHKHPERIYNCNECVIYLSKQSQVFMPRHKMDPFAITQSQDLLHHVSMHCCASASGAVLPPLIIFQDMLPSGTYVEDGPPDAMYQVNTLGLSDSTSFLSWFKKIFVRYSKPTPDQAVLLLLEDSTIYNYPKLIKYAEESNVILMTLKPGDNAEFYHPLDSGLYRTLDKQLTFLSMIGQTSSGLWINKDDLPPELGRLFRDKTLTSKAKSGFEKCGIHPHNSATLEMKSCFSIKKILTGKHMIGEQKPVKEVTKAKNPQRNSEKKLPATSKQCKRGQKSMDSAIASVRKGSLNYVKAAKQFRIGLQSLVLRLHYRLPRDVEGAVPTLSRETEEMVHNYISYMANIGFPLTTNQVLMNTTCIEKSLENPALSDDSPSFEWWLKFIQNHPKDSELLELVSENVQLEKQQYSVMNDPKHYYQLIKNIMDRNNLHQFPQYIYRCDQMLIDLSKSNKILSLQPSQHLVEIVSDCVSLTCCVSASGSILPPVINFKDEFPTGNFSDVGPKMCLYGYSRSALMNSQTFLKWFENIFLPYSKPNTNQTVILFMDSLASYCTSDLMKLAELNNVVLVAMAPNSNLTPIDYLDEAIYDKLASCLLLEATRSGTPDEEFWISKEYISSKLSEVLQTSLLKEDIQDAFDKCGIYPLDFFLAEVTCSEPWFLQTMELYSDPYRENGGTNDFEGFDPLETEYYAEKNNLIPNFGLPNEELVGSYYITDEDFLGSKLKQPKSGTVKRLSMENLSREQRFEEACNLIHNGYSINKAAATCNIPKTSLYTHLKGKSISQISNEALPEIEEADLVEYLHWMAKICYPRAKEDIPDIVKYILDRKSLVMFEKGNNFPSITWVEQFLCYHQELQEKLNENSTECRMLSSEMIIQHYAKLESLLETEHSLNASDFLQPENGSRIFNCDQVDFDLGINLDLDNILKESEVDAFVCISACGNFMKPFLMTKEKNPISPSAELGTIDKFYHKMSKSGHMDGNLFAYWLESCFEPHLRKNSIETPVILFFDGYKIQLTLPAMLFAQEKGIILFCFPTHSLHITQPLTVSYFKVLKEVYCAMLMEQLTNNADIMNKERKYVPYLLIEAMADIKMNSIIYSFESTFLVPYSVRDIQVDEGNAQPRLQPRFDVAANSASMHSLGIGGQVPKRKRGRTPKPGNETSPKKRKRGRQRKNHESDVAAFNSSHCLLPPTSLEIQIKEERLSDYECESGLTSTTAISKTRLEGNANPNPSNKTVLAKRKRTRIPRSKEKEAPSPESPVQSTIPSRDPVSSKEKLHYLIGAYFDSKNALKHFESCLPPNTLMLYKESFEKNDEPTDDLYKAWKKLYIFLQDAEEKVEIFAMHGDVLEPIAAFGQNDVSTLIQATSISL